MYTTKEIQDMFQINAIVEKSKEIAKQSIDFTSTISDASVAYFDVVTDRKFVTYTSQVKKGVQQVTSATEKFVDGFVLPNSFASSKN